MARYTIMTSDQLGLSRSIAATNQRGQPASRNQRTLFLFFLSDRVGGLTRLIRFHRKTTSNNRRHCSSLGLIPIGSLREVKRCPVLLGGGRVVLKVKEGRYCLHSRVIARANYYWCNQFPGAIHAYPPFTSSFPALFFFAFHVRQSPRERQLTLHFADFHHYILYIYICVDQSIVDSTRQAQLQAPVNTIGHSANLNKTRGRGGGGWVGPRCMQTWPMKTPSCPAAPFILSF